MKKFLFCLLMTVTVFSFAANAQAKGKVAKLKERVKAELKIDDTKADSVVSIVQDYMTTAKTMRSNTSLTAEQKQSSLKSLRQQEIARLRKHLNNKQIKQLQGVVQQYRSNQKSNTKKSSADSGDE